MGKFCTFGGQIVATLYYSQNMTKKAFNCANAPQPIGPYSSAVAVGNMLFVSGQVAKHPATGEMITAEIKAETTRVMDNLKAILEEGGFSFADVVKTSIFLKDMNQFAQVNEVYGSYFKDNYPARETVQVARLPLDVNVEISVIAVKS